MGSVSNAFHREPWNKGKIVGQKAPFKLKDIWALRVRLQLENRVRELALFNLGIDSKLRGCDLVSIKVRDICHGDQVATRAVVMQHKTKRPVQFEITQATREAVQKWIKQAGLGKERVRRLMKQHGIKARTKRKFVVTTDSKHNLPVAPDLVQRRFNPEAPNQLWSGDITYIATDEGWVYLAAVIDLFSRQVVGWSMKSHMQTSLVKDALTMAWFRRRPDAGLIFHSDRGSQ